MSTVTLPIADADFTDDNAHVASGQDVLAQDKALRDFINGSNFDPTDNIKISVPYPWTSNHSWTVSNASTDNLALTVSAVMATNKYGFKIASSAAQVNSALLFLQLSSASSTVACLEFSDAGTGSTIKIAKSGDGAALQATQSSTSAATAPVVISQAGTGPLVSGTLRSLSGLNSCMTAAVLTTAQTADNTATEMSLTDLNITLPANFLKAGTTILGTVWGVLTTPGAGPATARVRVYYGGTAGTVLLATAATVPTINLTSALTKLTFQLTCLTTGGAGTIEAQGNLVWNSNTAPANLALDSAGTGFGNPAAIAIDTTVQKDLTISWKWGTAVAGCTFVARSGYIEIIK